MFCRSVVSWFACTFVAAVVAAHYSRPDTITGSDPEVKVDHLTADPNSSTMEPTEESAAVDVAALLDAGERATVTLVAGDTRLVAHKALLAARSPVFAAIFGHDTLEASGGRVTVTDVEGPVLRQLVAYLYTLQAPQLPAMATRLLVAADRYGVLGLKAECERQVEAQLSVENAAATAVLAVRHSCKSLRQAAVAFIKDHIFHVVGTRGWADAARTQPEDFAELSRLLSALAAESSTLATTTADGGATHAAGPPSDRSHTPAAGAPPTPRTPDYAAISLLRNLSGEEKGRRLLSAAKHGAVQEVQAVLLAGAHVRAAESDRWTALQWAAYKGHVEAVLCLLLAGSEVDVRDTWLQQTPLHWAAWNGHAAVVRLLVAASADPNAKDKNGWTPLHLAAASDHTAVAAALLEAGADRGATTDMGDTPLDISRQYNRWQLTDMLS